MSGRPRVTHAQSQKAWREKKKTTDADFQAAEAGRKRERYIRRADLTPKQLAEKREKGKLAAQSFRDRKKAKKRKADESSLPQLKAPPYKRSKRLQRAPPPTPGISSNCGQIKSNPSPTSTPSKESPGSQRMIVRFPFPSSSQGISKGHPTTDKRVNRAAARAYRLLASERQKSKRLQLANWRLHKKVQRRPNKITTISPTSPVRTMAKKIATPIKNATSTLRNIGISPTKFPSLKKTLTLHNVVVSELRDIDGGQKVIKDILKGKHVKRARCVTALSKHLALDRRTFVRKIKKKSEYKKAVKSELLRRSIILFLKREDNSTCLPGKKDTVSVNRKKEQKYILTDYLGNLYKKYTIENPSKQVILSFFIRCRSKNIALVKYNARKVCLCTRHQNMSLMLRAIQPITHFTISPDAFIQNVNPEEAFEKIASSCPSSISFDRWKRVDVQIGDRTVKKVKRIPMELPKADFASEFRTELDAFLQHAHRVHEQYENVRVLKDDLPPGHVTVQMDFAENWTPGHFEEIQSAYFAKDQITLHPVVLHYTEDNKLAHHSYILVSDERSHTAGTVFAFLKVITSLIKRDLPQTHTVHYLTDSPTSQYRNRHIFGVVSQHAELFQLSTTWTYFEAGHGKGPCDGIGGTSKRMADLAVKRGYVLQTAEEYTDWGNTSGSAIKYIHVADSEITKANAELKLLSAKTTITGTMSIHAVVQVDQGKIATRTTSCFKQCCFNEGRFTLTCPGWVEHCLQREQTKDGLPDDPVVLENAIASHASTIDISSFVAALYDRKWYIGVVKEVQGGEYLISFLEQTSSTRVRSFKWPAKEDLLWVLADDILTKIAEPQPCGSSRRVFKISPEDTVAIEAAFLDRF